jgi:hypothetical protein
MSHPLTRRRFLTAAAVAGIAGTAGATTAQQPPDAVRFKIVNQMGTAIRVRLVHFETAFAADILKDKELLPVGQFLKKGERAIIVFDHPTGKILLQDKKDITAAVFITLKPTGADYKALP